MLAVYSASEYRTAFISLEIMPAQMTVGMVLCSLVLERKASLF
jgi:hypothetical protein